MLQPPPLDGSLKVRDEALADYIGHIAHDLSRLAKESNMESIAYLLDLVAIEANSLTPGRTRSRPERKEAVSGE